MSSDAAVTPTQAPARNSLRDNVAAHVPFRLALWIGPLAAIIHNLEEYPGIVDYGQRHLAGVGIVMPSTRELLPAVVLADLLPVLAATLAATSPHGSLRRLPFLVVQAGYFANAFSHIGQTLLFRDYSPGTVTAVLLSIPVNAYLFRRAYAEGFVPRRQIVAAAGLGVISMPLGILGLQALGRLIAGTE